MVFNPIPKLLKELRLEAGLSCAKAAKIAKVTPSSWSGWESGRHTPNPKRMGSIAKAVKLAPYELGRLVAIAWAEHYGLLAGSRSAAGLSKLEKLAQLERDLEQLPLPLRSHLRRMTESMGISFVQLESMISEVEELVEKLKEQTP